MVDEVAADSGEAVVAVAVATMVEEDDFMAEGDDTIIKEAKILDETEAIPITNHNLMILEIEQLGNQDLVHIKMKNGITLLLFRKTEYGISAMLHKTMIPTVLSTKSVLSMILPCHHKLQMKHSHYLLRLLRSKLFNPLKTLIQITLKQAMLVEEVQVPLSVAITTITTTTDSTIDSSLFMITSSMLSS